MFYLDSTVKMISESIQRIVIKTVNVTLTKNIVAEKCGGVGDQLMRLKEKIERGRKIAAAVSKPMRI